MADFQKALEKTLRAEGGYSNNPNDKGGETFCGISRKYWPDWSGWAILDGARGSGVSIESFSKQTSVFVDMHVSPFYRLNFWLPIRGDEIESQEIAEYLFDFAVNSGIGDAVKALQKAIDVVWDCDVDGIVGEQTITAIYETIPIFEHEIKERFRAYRLAHILENIGKGNIHPSFARGLAERAMA